MWSATWLQGFSKFGKETREYTAIPERRTYGMELKAGYGESFMAFAVGRKSYTEIQRYP